MAPQLDFTYEIDEFNQYPITFQLPGNTYHSKKMFNTQEAMEFIREAEIVKKQLNGFLPVKNDQNNFVSIGENCSSAWYLKQVGLKKASYPFDWAFSSPDIILDCIKDNFKKFMDKNYIKPNPNHASAGHLYYHSKLFHHRNPLNSEEDYHYYQRCCDRFLRLIDRKMNTTYLITLINEPQKRPGWAKGFTQRFRMPLNQDYRTVIRLTNHIKSINSKSQFIIVDHYTNQFRKAQCRIIDESVITIQFSAGGASTGVYYCDPLDDFCYKLLMRGLS